MAALPAMERTLRAIFKSAGLGQHGLDLEQLGDLV